LRCSNHRNEAFLSGHAHCVTLELHDKHLRRFAVARSLAIDVSRYAIHGHEFAQFAVPRRSTEGNGEGDRLESPCEGYASNQPEAAEKVDVPKLSVTIGMLFTLNRFAVRLQTVTGHLQQFRNSGMANCISSPPKFPGFVVQTARPFGGRPNRYVPPLIAFLDEQRTRGRATEVLAELGPDAAAALA
jgi:hypothetical protein